MADDIVIIVDETNAEEIIVTAEPIISETNIEIQQDYAPVQAVNGKIGWVTLDKTDIGLSNVENLSILGSISGMAVLQYNDQTISGTKTFINPLYAPNLLYKTGSQTISGIKTFVDKTYVSGLKFQVLGTGAGGSIPAYEQGMVFYDDTNHTLNLYVDNPEVTLQVGQENWVRVKNQLGATINNGNLVYIAGGVGANPYVQLAIANSDTTSASTLGMATHNISTNEFGYITTFGIVNDVDTDGYSVGDTLYLSPTTSGQYTNVKPQAPQHLVSIGTVIRANKNNGVIFVNISNGYELEELHDVRINNKQNGQFLIYNSGSGVWYNTQSFPVRPYVNGAPILLSGEVAPADLSSTVQLTGDQHISGIKNFYSRPTVNGTGIMLSGEAAQLPTTIVYITGDQNISGTKNFYSTPTVNGVNVLTGIDLSPYATVANLQSTGSNLNNKINVLSGQSVLLNGLQTINNGKEFQLPAGESFLVINNDNNTSSNIKQYLELNSEGGTVIGYGNNYIIFEPAKTTVNGPLDFVTRPTVNNTGVLLSGEAVLVYGNQTINGNKTFNDNVYIKNLTVTGTQTIVNTTSTNVGSNYVLLNATGGARDAGIFIVTGSGMTGVNDTGAIIGYDVPANQWVFGNTSRNSDLSTLAKIASTTDISNYSGYINNTYATIINLETTGSNLDIKINSLSGYINSSNSNIVYTTGNQNINGIKSFADYTVFKDNLLYISQASGQISGIGYTGNYDGGQFLGKVKLSQNNTRLINVGNTWAAKDSSRNWYAVCMSANGQYQLAVIGIAAAGFTYISKDYGKTWEIAHNYSMRRSSVCISSDGKYQTTTEGTLGTIWISNDYGSNWNPVGPSKNWSSSCMSSDGKYQTAVATSSSQIYISSDYGNTWTAKDSGRTWRSVCMSSDGKYQTAVASSNQIYISSDYGNTWTAKESVRNWYCVGMSSDGKHQTAGDYSGQIYISNDYGNTWVAKNPTGQWRSVCMSSDAKYQTICNLGGQIYISSDYGNTWIAKDSNRTWYGVCMSSDGKYQTAVANSSQIYVSVADEIIDGSFTSDNIYGNNLIYNTGDQNISGLKNFDTLPTFSGISLSTGYNTGLFYSNSNPSGFITGVDLSPYATVLNLNSTGQNLQSQIDVLSVNSIAYAIALG